MYCASLDESGYRVASNSIGPGEDAEREGTRHERGASDGDFG